MYYSTDFLVCISIAPRNNVCGAREFSVKLVIFSETSREITHFLRELRWSLPTGERSIVMSLSVCLYVFFLSAIISSSDLYQFSVHVSYGSGSVLPCRRSDMYFRFYE